MKAFTLLLFICLAAPLLQNCGTPDTPTYECTPDITVPFPQDALDRFYFKTGSWWVYEEINNQGVEDSIWVTKAEIITEPPNPKIYGTIRTKKCYTGHYVDLISRRYGTLRRKMGVSGPYDGFDYDKEFFRIEEIGEMTNLQNTCLLSMDGNDYRSLNCMGDSVSFVDTLWVNGNPYINTLCFSKDQVTFGYIEKSWHVKNLGMVKYRRTDGSEWELVRYSVVQ